MFNETGKIIGNDLPYKYLNDYVNAWFSEENRPVILELSTVYVNDTFFTLIPLLYGPKEVAFAWVLISWRQLKIEIDNVSEEKWK